MCGITSRMISHTCDQVALEAPDSNSERHRGGDDGQIKVKRNHERMMEAHVPKTKGGVQQILLPKRAS